MHDASLPLDLRKLAAVVRPEDVRGHLLGADAGLEEAGDGLVQRPRAQRRQPSPSGQKVGGRGRPRHDWRCGGVDEYIGHGVFEPLLG